MVILHAKYINSFYKTWLIAKSIDIQLPETEDKDYKSLDTLLKHIFRSARSYMIWICKNLELPDPNIKDIPKTEVLEKEAELYLLHILDKWHTPLDDIEEPKFHSPTYPSNWGVEYYIDSMLEHAVIHPI